MQERYAELYLSESFMASALNGSDEHSFVFNALRILKGFSGDKTRRDGTPEYVHPLSVANILITKGYRDPELIAAALLHDLIEDYGSQVDYAVLEKLGASKRVIKAVIALTRQQDEPYFGFMVRCAQNPDANIIKSEGDLEHNLFTMCKTKPDHDWHERRYTFAQSYMNYIRLHPSKSGLSPELFVLENPDVDFGFDRQLLPELFNKYSGRLGWVKQKFDPTILAA